MNARSRRVRTAASRGVLACAAAAAAAVGCDTKGFVDPTEMLRSSKGNLVLPIVSQIDPKLEEADVQWATAQDPTADDIRAVDTDYRISRDDMLGITLSDINGPNTETVKQARVSESGNISLPYLDQPIHAAGLTEFQLEQTIIAAYRQAGLIQHAQVSVTIVEARGRAFSILGNVQQPGEYAIVEADFRLLNALVLGRNVTNPFVDYIYVVRHNVEEPASTQPTIEPFRAGQSAEQPPVGGGGGAGPTSVPTTGPSSDELAPRTEANMPVESVAQADVAAQPAGAVANPAPSTPPPAPAAAPRHVEKVILAAQSGGPFQFNDPGPQSNTRVIRIPYEALRRGDLRYNITIRPHDVIYVSDPLVGFYYVGGHAGRPGAYQFTGQKVTVKDAVISAGMLDGIAIPQRTDIIRRVGTAQEVFVRVDLEKIFSGEQPDVYLKPGDKVIVGTNAIAPFLAAIRGGFRVTYGFGFLYDRNYAYPTTTGVIP